MRKFPIWVTLICPECGKQFTVDRQINRRQKYCSIECRKISIAQKHYCRHRIKKGHEYKLIDKTCPRCGNVFKGHTNSKYCSNCLKWLAYNSPTYRERSTYAREFNVRRDCDSEDYIEVKSNRYVTYAFGKEYHSISEMCRCFNINQSTFRSKLKQGYSIEEAINLMRKI